MLSRLLQLHRYTRRTSRQLQQRVVQIRSSGASVKGRRTPGVDQMKVHHLYYAFPSQKESQHLKIKLNANRPRRHPLKSPRSYS